MSVIHCFHKSAHLSYVHKASDNRLLCQSHQLFDSHRVSSIQ